MKTLLFSGLAIVLLLSGCVSTPQSRADNNPDLFESFTPEQKETILKGEVDIGFTPEMVMMAAGLPSRKATKRTIDGETIVWTYYKYSARPIYGSGYGYGHYGNYFTYSSRYGCYVRRPFYGSSFGYVASSDREENLVVEFSGGSVVAFEMIR